MLGGRPVAFMPDHATLIVTNAETVVPHRLEMVERSYTEAARSLSPYPYTVDDSGVVIPYPAPDGHPATPSLRRAETLLASTEYTVQKSCLDQHYEEELIATFVASLKVTKKHDTVTVWGEDVDSLLPRADYVAFVGEATEPFRVPWDSVVEATHLAPEADLNPPRYRVHAWPTPDVLGHLRARATAIS